MDWLSLTLLCALSLAFSDAVTKARLGGLGDGERVFARLILPGLLLLPVALWHWPARADWGAFLPWVAVSVPFELVAMLLYVRALHAGPLSLTLPYLAFTPVFVALTGWLLLGERVASPALGGIALVVLGSWLLNAGEHRHPWRVLRAVFEQRGARGMLAVAALYSITAVTTRGGVRHVDGVFFGAFYLGVVGLVGLVWFAVRRETVWRAVRRGPAAVWWVAGLMAAMVLLHFAALQRVEVASMIAVKRISLLFGAVIGVLWLGEPAGFRRVLAGAVMIAGAALVVLTA